MVEIDFHVEGIADHTVITQASGVENDLGVIAGIEANVADPVNEGGDFAGGGMIREPAAHKALNLRGEGGEERGALQEFRALDRTCGQHHLGRLKHAGVAGDGVAHHELMALASLAHILHVVVEQELQARAITMAGAWGEAELIDEQFSGVEHARGFGEVLLIGAAIVLQIGLMQGARCLLNREVGRQARLA